MTPLEEKIRRRIAQSGPINVADYMEMCLAHPLHGYYMTRDPLGRAGDFTTAPEISQIFGEIIGLWLAQVWLDQGKPAPFLLVELGPGRGTLMADALRATRMVAGFHQAAQIVLMETSPALRGKQAEALSGVPNLVWVNHLGELPERPTLLVANEFFDALPIRQFVRSETGWRERMVGLAGGELRWGLAPELALGELETRWPGVSAGTVAEVGLVGRVVASAIGELIAHNGGAALVVDYGSWHGTGDTLQALKSHQFVDPLTSPGEADLTAHVNFSDIAASARRLRPWRLLTQRQFLLALGVEHRAAALAAQAADPASIQTAFRRLTAANEMGTLFKALCLTREVAPPPPGFAD